MKHYYSLEEVALENSWLTVGVYDGVHRGHQEIIRRLTAGAHASGDPAVVLTFDPHPASVLGRGEIGLLTLPGERAELLASMEVDAVITAIASSGLFEVRGIRFGIDERNPGMNEARRNAVEDARGRAAAYAQAAVVQLGDIIRITDADARTPRDFMAAAPMARSVQVIPPETLTLSATVTITWRIATKP